MFHPQQYQCKWKNFGKYEQINNMNLLGADTIQKQMVGKTVERMYIYDIIYDMLSFTEFNPGVGKTSCFMIRSDTAVSGNT